MYFLKSRTFQLHGIFNVFLHDYCNPKAIPSLTLHTAQHPCGVTLTWGTDRQQGMEKQS